MPCTRSARRVAVESGSGRCLFLDVLQEEGTRRVTRSTIPTRPSTSARATARRPSARSRSARPARPLRSGTRSFACGPDADSLRIAAFANEHVGRWLTCTDADVDGDGRGDGQMGHQPNHGDHGRGRSRRHGHDPAGRLSLRRAREHPLLPRLRLDARRHDQRPASGNPGGWRRHGRQWLAALRGRHCRTRFAMLNNRGFIDAAETTDFDDTWIKEPSNQVATGIHRRALRIPTRPSAACRFTSTRKNDAHGIAIARLGLQSPVRGRRAALRLG